MEYAGVAMRAGTMMLRSKALGFTVPCYLSWSMDRNELGSGKYLQTGRISIERVVAFTLIDNGILSGLAAWERVDSPGGRSCMEQARPSQQARPVMGSHSRFRNAAEVRGHQPLCGGASE
jgi:hypothetical protein